MAEARQLLEERASMRHALQQAACRKAVLAGLLGEHMHLRLGL